MKIHFRKARLSKANLQMLVLINKIIEQYQESGYVLTLRQLYYQLVTKEIIPNVQSEYAKLSIILKEGRMAGIVDWEAIEDRIRIPSVPASFNNPKDILEQAIRQYARYRMQGQKNYVEVWVEKDALSGVLKRVTSKYHIPIMVNRGYSSVSAMFDAHERFQGAFKRGQNVVILYLGDFDPSGQDMIRDIEDRIYEFWGGKEDVYPGAFQIVPIALTKEQIDLYKPPANPAKITDPRAKDFIAKHGVHSWEVDALKPEILHTILETNIRKFITMAEYAKMVAQEKPDKEALSSLLKYL